MFIFIAHVCPLIWFNKLLHKPRQYEEKKPEEKYSLWCHTLFFDGYHIFVIVGFVGLLKYFQARESIMCTVWEQFFFVFIFSV